MDGGRGGLQIHTRCLKKCQREGERRRKKIDADVRAPTYNNSQLNGHNKQSWLCRHVNADRCAPKKLQQLKDHAAVKKAQVEQIQKEQSKAEGVTEGPRRSSRAPVPSARYASNGNSWITMSLTGLTWDPFYVHMALKMLDTCYLFCERAVKIWHLLGPSSDISEAMQDDRSGSVVLEHLLRRPDDPIPNLSSVGCKEESRQRQMHLRWLILARDNVDYGVRRRQCLQIASSWLVQLGRHFSHSFLPCRSLRVPQSKDSSMADHLSSVFTRVLLRGSSSTEGQLASVLEERTTGFTDVLGPPPNSYRNSIRNVGVVFPEWHIRSSLSSQSGQSGSNYDYSDSGDSSELTKIAQRMVSDGYTQRMVRAFHNTSLTGTIGPDPALKNWFIELDVDWVLYSRLQLQLQKVTAYWLQELVQRWIRALIIIVASIKEVMLVHDHEALAVTRTSYMIMMMPVVSLEAQHIFDEIRVSLKTEENGLTQVISNTMMDIRSYYCDNPWTIEIARSGGRVHRKIQFLVHCILSMRKACASTLNSAQSQNTVKLRDAIDETIDYLKDQLLRKSEWFLDPRLRSMFLLNNSYFVAQAMSHSHPSGIKLTPECEKYMDLYLHFSWGHVLSCIPKSNFPGLLRRWINTSPLAKFESAFHKTYQTQKFWKVPDPQLRDVLRRAIIERVISGSRDYLKEHPELAEQVSQGSNSPEVLEDMLGEFF
uniref:Exocyst subunit Exo70 family protein n=1 Tax=Aegilops tauschii TaxID=37682 RepID=M8BBM8_AEGTA